MINTFEKVSPDATAKKMMECSSFIDEKNKLFNKLHSSNTVDRIILMDTFNKKYRGVLYITYSPNQNNGPGSVILGDGLGRVILEIHKANANMNNAKPISRQNLPAPPLLNIHLTTNQWFLLLLALRCGYSGYRQATFHTDSKVKHAAGAAAGFLGGAFLGYAYYRYCEHKNSHAAPASKTSSAPTALHS